MPPKAPSLSENPEAAPQAATNDASKPRKGAKRIDGPAYTVPGPANTDPSAEAPVIREVKMATGAVRRDH